MNKSIKLFGKLLLGGVLFAAIGCTDLTEDIRQLENKVDNTIATLVSGTIEPLQADLAAQVERLENAQAAMKTEILAELNKEKAALEAADAAINTKIADAGKRIDDLQASFLAANTDLLAKITTINGQISTINGQLTDLNDKYTSLKNAHDADKQALEAKIAALTSDLATLNTALETAKSELNARIDGLMEELTVVIEDLQADISKLYVKDAELQEKLDNTITDLGELKSDLATKYGELKDLISGLDTKVSKNAEDISKNAEDILKNAGDISKLREDLTSLGTALNDLTSRVTSVELDLVSFHEEFTEYKATVATEIARLDDRIDSVEASIKEINEVVIPEMKEQIKKNKELSEQNAKDILTNKGLFDEFKKAAEETYAELRKADEALSKTIAALAERVGVNETNIGLLQVDVEGLQVDVEGLQGAVNDINIAVAGIRSDLAKYYEEFLEYKKESDESFIDIYGKIEVINGEIKGIHGDIEVINGEIDGINTKITSIEGRVATNEQSIKDLLIADEVLANSLKELTEKLESVQNELNGKINDVQDKLDAEVENRIAAISDLQGQIDSAIERYDKSIEDINKDIKNLSEDLENYKKEAAEALEAAKKALTESLNTAIEGVQKQITKNANDIETLDGSLAELAVTVKENTVAIGVLENRLIELDNSYTQKFADIWVEFGNVRTEISTLEANLLVKINDLRIELIGYIADNISRIYKLEQDVAGLVNQIQSITYVPTHADHKARVNYLKWEAEPQPVPDVATEIVRDDRYFPGVTELEFKVKPAEYANSIASLGKFIALADILSFDAVEVKSEAAEYGLVIEDIRPSDKEGNFILSTRAVNFDPAFWEGNKSYSVSLNVKVGTGSSNLASCYVNLTPADEILFGGLVIGKEVNGVFAPADIPPYDIPFTDIEKVVTVFEGYEVKAAISSGNDVEYLDFEELESLYQIVTTGPEYSHQAFNSKHVELTDEEANFVVEDGQVVKVDKVLQSSVGNYEEVTATYTCDGIEYPFIGTVKIAMSQAKAKFENCEKVWLYNEYKEDPALYEGKLYEFASAFTEPMSDHEHLAKDLAYWWDGEPVVYDVTNPDEPVVAEGVTANLVAKSYDSENDTYSFTIEGYEYGKTYTIKLHKVYSTVEFNGEVTISFIGLEDISYDYGIQNVSYNHTSWNDEYIKGPEVTGMLDELFDLANGNAKHFEKAEDLLNYVLTTYNTDNSEFVANYKADISIVNGDSKHLDSVNGDVPTRVSTLRNTCLDIDFSTLNSIRARVMTEKVTNYDCHVEYGTVVNTLAGMKITFEGRLNVVFPKYTVIENASVNTKETVEGVEAWVSEVRPSYVPGSNPTDLIASFDAKMINLLGSFMIQLEDGKKINQSEFEAYGISMKFEIPSTEKIAVGDDISIAEDGHTMTYYGKNDYVNVDGTLYINNIAVPSSFDDIFDNFKVKKFDPIYAEDFLAKVEIDTKSSANEYTKYIFSELSLSDKRYNGDGEYIKGFELINKSAQDIADTWLTTSTETSDDGNEIKVNVPGFNGDVYCPAVELYNISYPTFKPFKAYFRGGEYDGENALSEISSYVTFNTTTGVIKFTNLNQLGLRNPVEVIIDVQISYPWNVVNGKVSYLLK